MRLFIIHAIIISYVFIRLLFIANINVLAADTLIKRANKAATDYCNEIEQLAVWAEKNHLRQEARLTRLILLPSRPNNIFIKPFPREAGTLDLPKGLPTSLPTRYAAEFNKKNVSKNDETNNTEPPKPTPTTTTVGKELSPREIWQIQLRQLRIDYAKRLESMAKTAVKNDRGTLAIQMAIAGLQANPDNKLFRNVFGYEKIKLKNSKKEEWCSHWEAEHLKNGWVNHPVFGWMPEHAVKRYENGERYCNGKWISEEEDTAYHQRSIEQGWNIKTMHYDILCTHSHEEGVRASRLLEDLYFVWHLICFRYIATDTQLVTLFEDRPVSFMPVRYKVRIYRDKTEYDAATNAPDTGGIYKISYIKGKQMRGTAHFPGGSRSNGTLFHEGTHQLFQENCSSGRGINHWLIEGAATFFETLHKEGDWFVVGNKESGRIRSTPSLNNRYSIGEYCIMNVSKYCSVGSTGDGFYSRGDFYNHSCALFHFFMFYDDGEYRDALIMLLRLFYNGKDDSDTLPQFTKKTYRELEKEFNDYLQSP
ncbi:MAG: hypothetical protein LBP87_10625 [Planctomycetaceae bacterium]|jgi:hypothetical protein|nr:hypothetical protein [Planctomycetaceae bacterium]